ncbi:NlpC/P60 family protein [Actinokineospora sp. HUAS TT18]|uniref:NlpC/P60 family protein n=1 Tax=Actinokineospora sp. HUAS TT18 TaxID=3447451 RepID=UPI003F522D38
MRLRSLLVAAVALVGLVPGGMAAAETDSWDVPANPNARLLVDAARAQEGLSYCWGGGNADGPTIGDPAISKCGIATGPGFDCSGLVHYALAQAGMRLEDREAGEFAKLGTKVTDLAPGDLLFYDKDADNYIEHVSIYLGHRDKTGRRWVVEAYGDKGWTAPKYTVRVREYVAGEQKLARRIFGLQPKPTLDAVNAGSGNVRLTWSDYATETGYQISRGTSVITVGADTTSRTITGLPVDSQTCFRVRAYIGSPKAPTEVSDWSEPACAWTTPLPPAPTNVQASALDTGRIHLTWTDNATDETAYYIATTIGGATLEPNTVSYIWSGLEAGTEVCFTVIVVNTAGSAASDQVCATTLANGPAAPSGLTAEILGDAVHLMWTDNASDETGLVVRRRVGEVYDYATVFYYPNAVEDWLFNQPVGVELCYTVAAVRGGSRSAWSNEACVTRN